MTKLWRKLKWLVFFLGHGVELVQCSIRVSYFGYVKTKQWDCKSTKQCQIL